MGSSLLVVLLLGWIAIRNIRSLNREAQLQNEEQTETVTLIRYDGKTVKLTGILSKVATIIFLVSSVLAGTAWPEAGLIVFPAGAAMVVLFAYYWCGKQYLKRLSKYGYVVPENAKDYDDVLEKLPKADMGYVESEPYNRRSKAFWIVCIVILVVLLAAEVWYYCSWYFMKDTALAMVVMLVVVNMFWLAMASKFRKQMSNENYKEDVEIDKNRKNRRSPEYAAFLVVVMLFASGFVILTADSMIKYTYNAWVENDREDVRNVQLALEQAYDELIVMETAGQEGAGLGAEVVAVEDWESSKKQLAEGIDITSWGVPQDIYQEKVAEYLGISDFSELKDDFRAAKGDAVLYAELENGLIRVSLPNLYREVNLPIIISSEKKSGGEIREEI